MVQRCFSLFLLLPSLSQLGILRQHAMEITYSKYHCYYPPQNTEPLHSYHHPTPAMPNPVQLSPGQASEANPSYLAALTPSFLLSVLSLPTSSSRRTQPTLPQPTPLHETPSIPGPVHSP
ncbi:hypothetical protein E2C01_095459 [Portunus trituberculatus]|uniref:Uncharacterized protein n=1 Tax=Portunus trituberculatus TaxID=210409 RepID=A0A5B7JVB4_PORTR|nr:hypothetical protein [Portunus trituberculatus]